MDPTTKRLVAFTEVERRKKYLDKMTGEMKLLKGTTVSCLNNEPEKRPAIADVIKEFELFKVCTLSEEIPLRNSFEVGSKQCMCNWVMLVGG